MVVGLEIAKSKSTDKRDTKSKAIASRGQDARVRILELSRLPAKTTSRKACLVICNSYYGTGLDLGDPAINDGILAYERFSKLGYDAAVYYDIKKSEFMTAFNTFLGRSLDKLVVYYTGHGSNRYDTSGDEADRRDECLVFRDGVVADDDIHKIVVTRKCKELLLFADCCHSGTIFDITSAEYKSGIATISACADRECAAQYWFERKGQGCLTYYFWKLLDSGNFQLSALNKKLEPFGQHAEIMGDWMKFFR